MKKIKIFLVALLSISCIFALFGCTVSDKTDSSEDTVAYFPIEEVSLLKSESTEVVISAPDGVDVSKIRWAVDGSKYVSVVRATDDVTFTIQGNLAGTATLKIAYDGVIVDTLTIVVTAPDLDVYLPNLKLVLTQGDTVRVKGINRGNFEGTPVWSVNTEKITVESQELLAIVTVAEDCPDGAYTASLTIGDAVCNFTIIIGK